MQPAPIGNEREYQKADYNGWFRKEKKTFTQKDANTSHPSADGWMVCLELAANQLVGGTPAARDRFFDQAWTLFLRGAGS